MLEINSVHTLAVARTSHLSLTIFPPSIVPYHPSQISMLESKASSDESLTPTRPYIGSVVVVWKKTTYSKAPWSYTVPRFDTMAIRSETKDA